MKKILFLGLLALLSFKIHAQLIISNQGNGIVEVQYGDTDYSLFDPASATEVYVYLWIDESQTTPNLAMQYNDDWNDASSLIVLNWDAGQNKYIGTINFNTHNFIGEGVLPANTTINDFNLVLRDLAGDSATQSVDLIASNYGFVATTTASVHGFTVLNPSIKLFPTVTNSFFKINTEINSIDIYTLNGKLIKSFTKIKSIFYVAELSPAIYIVAIKTNKGNNIQKLIVK